MTLNTELTLLKLDRIAGTGAGSYQFNFSFEVELTAPITVHAATDEDSEFWGLLTENIHYTVQLLVGGGKINISNQGMIDTLMANLLPGGNLAFNFLIIQRTVPFSQDTPMPLDYDASLTELSDDRIVRQTQQLDNRTNRLENVPGIFLPNGVVGQPNEAGRLLKIMVDGRNRFKGANLTDYDSDNAIHSLVDFYCNENIIVSKNATITGTTTAVGRITGSSAGFSGDISIGGTLTVTGITTLNASLTINNANLTVTGSGTESNSTSGIISAPRIKSSYAMDIEGLLALNNTFLYVDLSNAQIQDLLFLKASTDPNAQFDLGSISPIDLSRFIINVGANRITKGTDLTTGPALINSDMIESATDLILETKTLKVASGNVSITSGYLALEGATSIFSLKSGIMKLQDKNVTCRIDTFQNGYALYVLTKTVNNEIEYDLIAGPAGSGGGGGTTDVDENIIAKGDGLGNVVNSDISETVEDVVIGTKSIVVATGDVVASHGDVIVEDDAATLIVKSGHMKLKDRHFWLDRNTLDTMNPDELRTVVVQRIETQIPPTPENPNGDTHDDYYLRFIVGSGGGGSSNITADLNRVVLSDGAGGGVNSSITEDSNRMVILNNKSLVAHGINTENSNIGQYNFSAITRDPHQIGWRFDNESTSTLAVGDSVPVNFKRIGTNIFELLPMIAVPTIPAFIPDRFFDNCIALWFGHKDAFTLREVYSDPQIKIIDSTISEATILQAQIDVLEGVLKTENAPAGALMIDPTEAYMVFVEYDSDITSINFSVPMSDSSSFTILFKANSGGLGVTFPANWNFSNGRKNFRSIDASWFVIDLAKNDVGDIFATYISIGYYTYGLTIYIVPPFYDGGLAKFGNISGTLVTVDPLGKAYDTTLANWQFNSSLIDSTTYVTKPVLIGGGVLDLLIDGSAAIFSFNHTEEITAINISINQDQANQDFIIYLWRIPGGHTQAELPIPGGCYTNMASIELKDGHAIIPMMWKKYNSTMTVLPGPAWDATY